VDEKERDLLDAVGGRLRALRQSRGTAADLVALAIGWRPTGEAFTAGLALGALGDVEVRVLGDAESPADFVRAINSGANAGLTV
jgi:hypothetical protein